MCSEVTHPPIHLLPSQRNQQQIQEHCQNGCYSLKMGTKLPNSWQDVDLNKEFAPWTGNPAGNLRSMGGALLQHCSVQALLLSLKWGRKDKCKWHLCAFLSILIWFGNLSKPLRAKQQHWVCLCNQIGTCQSKENNMLLHFISCFFLLMKANFQYTQAQSFLCKQMKCWALWAFRDLCVQLDSHCWQTCWNRSFPKKLHMLSLILHLWSILRLSICFVRKKELNQHATDCILLPQYCDMSGSDSVISALLIPIKNKLLHIYINPGSRISLVLQH